MNLVLAAGAEGMCGAQAEAVPKADESRSLERALGY